MSEKRYQVRAIEGDGRWQSATQEEARAILEQGYFDPEIPMGYIEDGHTVVTTKYEVRVNPKRLLTNRPPVQVEDDGEVLWA